MDIIISDKKDEDILEVNKNNDLKEEVEEEVEEEIKNEIFKDILDYDTLVISGGSSTGIVTLGALQYAYDNYLLNKVQTYIGTSSGSIISYLLIIGYSPIEIIIYICSHQLMEKIQHFNIVAMINGGGAASFTTIYEQLEKMTIDKIGFLPTFEDLKNKYGKTLICTTYNTTENKTEYISYLTKPTLPCLIGIKMSSNLPLIFEKYKYGNNFYIDGGVSDNFPIDIGDKMGGKILGIVLCSKDENFNNEHEMNILEYIYKLMFIPISQTEEYKIMNVSNKCKIIKLYYSKVKFFNFNINSKMKLDLFSSGYQQTKELFE
jgi:NTE family protein